jgi:hypothetical protein
MKELRAVGSSIHECVRRPLPAETCPLRSHGQTRPADMDASGPGADFPDYKEEPKAIMKSGGPLAGPTRRRAWPIWSSQAFDRYPEIKIITIIWDDPRFEGRVGPLGSAGRTDVR